eukprot:g3181.t1
MPRRLRRGGGRTNRDSSRDSFSSPRVHGLSTTRSCPGFLDFPAADRTLASFVPETKVLKSRTKKRNDKRAMTARRAKQIEVLDLMKLRDEHRRMKIVEKKQRRNSMVTKFFGHNYDDEHHSYSDGRKHDIHSDEHLLELFDYSKKKRKEIKAHQMKAELSGILHDIEGVFLGKPIREIFREFDLNKDGKISYDEFKKVLISKNLPNVGGLDRVFNLMEKDQDGHLKYNDFIKFYEEDLMNNLGEQKLESPKRFNLDEEQRKHLKHDFVKELMLKTKADLNHVTRALNKIFRKVDMNGDGMITYDEFYKALGHKNLNLQISTDKLRDLIFDCDADGSGVITYDEWIASLKMMNMNFDNIQKGRVRELEKLRSISEQQYLSPAHKNHWSEHVEKQFKKRSLYENSIRQKEESDKRLPMVSPIHPKMERDRSDGFLRHIAVRASNAVESSLKPSQGSRGNLTEREQYRLNREKTVSIRDDGSGDPHDRFVSTNVRFFGPRKELNKQRSVNEETKRFQAHIKKLHQHEQRLRSIIKDQEMKRETSDFTRIQSKSKQRLRYLDHLQKEEEILLKRIGRTKGMVSSPLAQRQRSHAPWTRGKNLYA